MKKLIEGLRTFVTTVHRSERELYENLARGQRPETVFITCSDSRVCPSTLTASPPGELFVIRNAGNIVPPAGHRCGEAASIEYAIEVLKVRDIIVCGHSDCGAMKAILAPAPLARMPAVAAWLEHAERVLEIVDQVPGLSPAERLNRAIEANVLTQLSHLRTLEPVAAAVERGDVEMHGWVFDIASGRVRAFEADVGEFVDLLDRHPAA
ncbi:MAG TPA: carbonic anhydrase [Sandaracinaceae bacterium]